MQKKFIHCFTCDDFRWADQMHRLNYRCRECESVIDLRLSKEHERKERKRLSLEKGKVFIKGKYEGNGSRPGKKGKRIIDKVYLDFIREQVCLIQNHECQTYVIHAHHHERVSQLGSDYTAVPLCALHHMKLHTMGIDSFIKKYGIDFEAQVSRLNILYKIRTGKEILVAKKTE